MKNINLFKKRQKSRINNLSMYIAVLFVLNALLLSSFIIAVEFNNQSSNTTKDSSEIGRNPAEFTNTNNMNKINYIGTSTVFQQPSLSIPQPTPSQNEVVTAPITDINGIKNTTLFWNYNTINNTLFNTTMSLGVNNVYSQAINSNLNYNTTSYVNTDGSLTTTPTHNRMGIMSYESSSNNIFFNNFNITLKAASTFTYINAERKNASTGIWESFLKLGTINGTTSIQTPISVTDTNVSLGYQITTAAYRSNSFSVNLPTTNSNFIVGHNVSYATIPAPNKPTQVTYYIKAYNNLNISAISPTYSYLADNIPTVTITSTATTIFGSLSYNLTVSVSDNDGASNINNNSIIAYYWVSDPAVLSQTALHYFSNVSSTTFLYQVSLPTTFLVGKTGTLSIYVNATDLASGVGKSAVKVLSIDNTGPNLQSYTINGTKNAQNDWVFNATTVPSIIATMTDPSGTKDATLHYRSNGGSYQTIVMTNLTLNSQSVTSMDFNATLPASSSSQFIEWYITAHDFGNNINTSATYHFYVDGDAPTLVSNDTYPPYITNSTQPILLFNVSDVIGVQTPITVYYSYDNQKTWSSTTVSNQINYNTQRRAYSTFSYTQVPYQIPDNTVSNISKQVIFPYTVDQATLTLSVTFTQGSYLRIWLANDLGKKVVVFDRLSGSINNVYSINLLKLGFTTNDFKNSTFFLIMESDSVINYGQINTFSIYLANYNIPLGYQYMINSFPVTGNDTTVYYFFHLVDNFNHQKNTTIYSFYVDGTAPKVAITSPTNITENATVYSGVGYTVDYNVSDKGGIFLIELYYMVNNKTSYNWNIVEKYVSTTNGSYSFLLTDLPQNGTLYFKVRVYDHAGFSSESPVYKIQFTTTAAPVTTSSNPNTESTSPSSSTTGTNNGNPISSLLIPILLGGTIVVVGGGGGYFGYKKMKNSGKLTAVKEKISSKRPKN